jgi:hypothetical protein
MSSKYAKKKAKLSHTDRRVAAFKPRYSNCSNCGRSSYIADTDLHYSKCGCGGTFQMFGATK